MYALVNCMFHFPLGKIKKNGTVGKKPKYYSTLEEVAAAYFKLSSLQRLCIAPAIMEGNQYTRIEFIQP